MRKILDKDSLLSIEDLQIGIQQGQDIAIAINGISFSIAKGETFALVGESGCGKSMTAAAILQLLPTAARFFSGSYIYYDGIDILKVPEVGMRKVRGVKIAMIFQEPMSALNPVLTIGQQLMEGLFYHFKLNKKLAYQRALSLLHSVGIAQPKQCFRQYPHQLSGGMKQRAVLAMALAGEPTLLIADEPTTALDVTIQSQILALLQEMQKKLQMSILLITHDLSVVAQMAHRVGVMYAGQLIEVASTKAFFRKPCHPYSQKLFAALPDLTKRGGKLEVIKGNVPSLLTTFSGCRFASRCELCWQTCEDSQPTLLKLSEDHHVRCHLYTHEDKLTHRPVAANRSVAKEKSETSNTIKSTVSNPILRVDSLQVYYPIFKGLLKRQVGQIKAVDDVSFMIEKGKTFALVGESGCGKSSLAKSLLLLEKPTAGSIYYQGEKIAISQKHLSKSLCKALQIVFQDPFSSLNGRMRVIDIIAEGVITQGMYKNRQALIGYVKQLLEKVGLPSESLFRYPHEFSGGQRQRICIARALAVQPQLIICDEPTSALDLSVQAQILNLLNDLQQEYQLTYLFITHNISAVAYMADTIAVMYLGKIVEYGKTHDILQTPKHPYTQALLSSVLNLQPVEKNKQKVLLTGEQPSAASPPTGCYFASRCPKAMKKCLIDYPKQTPIGTGFGYVHCHLY